ARLSPMEETMKQLKTDVLLPRRALFRAALLSSGLALTGRLSLALAQSQAPAVVPRDGARPQLPYGVMSGDVTADRAIVWSRADRPSRLIVAYDSDERMKHA